MIRHLFILISLSCHIESYTLNINEHLIEKGDTFWAISRQFDISINELIEINTFKNFKSGIPILNLDQIIKVSRSDQDDVANYCYSDNTFSGINFSKKLNKYEIITSCIKYLQDVLDPYVIGVTKEIFLGSKEDPGILNTRFWGEKEAPKLDKKFWDTFFSDKRYAYFFYNLYYIESENSMNNCDEIMLYAALKGDAVSLEYVSVHAESFYENHKYIHNAKSYEEFVDMLYDKVHPEVKRLNKNFYFGLGTDDENSYKEFISFDTNLLNHQDRIYFYFDMLSATYKAGDISYFRFEQEMLKFIGQSESKLISWHEFVGTVNLMYTNLNLNNNKRVLDMYKLMEKRIEADEYLDFFYRTIENNYYEQEDMSVGPVLSFILNADSAYYEEHPDEYTLEDLIIKRKDLMTYVYEAVENGDMEDIEMAGWHSDTGLKLARAGKCEKASSFLEESFSVYEESASIESTDYFDEPIQLSNCFAGKGNLKVAQELLNFASKSLDGYVYDKTFYEGLIDIKFAEIKMLEGDPAEAFRIFRKSTDRFFKNQSKFSATIPTDLIVIFVNTYIKIYFKLDEKNFNLSNIKTPNEVIGLNERLQTRRRLEQLKIDDSKTDMVKLQKSFLKNNEDISKYENLLVNEITQNTYIKLNSLYEDRKKIMNKMLKKSPGVDALFNPSGDEYANISENIEEDAVFLSYFIDSNEILILVADSEGDKLISIKNSGSRNINYMVRELRSSIDDLGKPFLFDQALELYNTLLRPIESIIQNKKTIYIFGSELENLPFGILVSGFNNSNKISDYQRLISADWLIKSYSFARVFPSSNNRLNRNFENKFLGFANPDSFDELGLPLLPNSESEIRELSLASGDFNKDFLLTKSNASKKNLISMLDESFERIVFATHSVPPGWNGLTKESALVLADKNGDFLLTATEIVDLDIKSDIVVLSSCNSDIKGTDSLYKSFLVAGANSVMYSNWNLETLSAEKITESVFKTILFEAIPKHEALRKASIKIMNDYDNKTYAHPAFWGNFSIAYRSI